MATIDPSRLPLLLVAGGLAFGGVLAAATPTRMREAPEPPWRQLTAPRDGVALAQDDAATDSGWFSAATYEVFPAPRWSRAPQGEALPPPAARFGDDAQWRMDDADLGADPAADAPEVFDEAPPGGDDRADNPAETAADPGGDDPGDDFGAGDDGAPPA
ncbi:hypothetical protein [Novosphingobium huizhouense]|uniref:hypothetical protein n=1 Tax=Novosphingobium huizhouense TaxID=2866625 RepID=UPI001CD8B3ED|nr:hypothetical protein [Novosphingobium huizhouense]